MPRYDYACEKCGHRFEAVHSITSDPLSVCPECGGHLRRVIGPVGVAFKGSGFYRTDSRAAAKNHKSSRTSSSSSSTSSSGSSSSGASSAESSASGSSSAGSPSDSSTPASPSTGAQAKPATPSSKPKSDS